MIAKRPLASGDARLRILAAASKLVAEGGSEAATTRAVSEAAAVQAPTIYRLFGDKAGLLEAVAEKTLADFIATKARREVGSDPVEILRNGWDDYIGFNLAHPSVFLLTASRPGEPSRATAAGHAVLAERVQRIAAVGRLRVTEERAVDLIESMGKGVLLVMLSKPPATRGDLSNAALEAVFAAVIADPPADLGPGPAGAASALRARLDEETELTPGERKLLDEWLERLARAR